jgi:hypothetical protein
LQDNSELSRTLPVSDVSSELTEEQEKAVRELDNVATLSELGLDTLGTYNRFH